MDRLDLAVIESRWWEDRNDSVQGTFEMLAGILVGNPFGYHYEMFSNTGSIKEMIPRIARTKDIRHIHVAAHGDEQAIYGPGEQKISRTVLANALRDIDARQLYGVFLGSCKFGWSIERLMEQSGVTWVAGYVERVYWLHSSVMDAFFLACVLLERSVEPCTEGRTGRQHAGIAHGAVDPGALPLQGTRVQSQCRDGQRLRDVSGRLHGR